MTLRRFRRMGLDAALPMALAAAAFGQQNAPDEFVQSIRPILAQNCSACHNPANPKNRINFLKAATTKDVYTNRGLWRDVATQLRNRTMPPVDSKLTEEDRLRVSQWVDKELLATACYAGDFAGAVALRRLNRREYHNTIRDLLGVDFNAKELFPADGTGGAGFDTNGETLYVPPLMTERYLEAAQEILDRAIITPDLAKTFAVSDLLPADAKATATRTIAPGSDVTAPASIYLDGDYVVRVTAEQKDGMGKLLLKIDGESAGVPLTPAPVRGFGGGRGRGARPPAFQAQVRLARGLRMLSVAADGAPVTISAMNLDQKPVPPAPEKMAMHYRLLGTEPGVEPLQPRKAAEQILRSFMRRAYRRPVETGDIEPVLKLYDRAAERGDPFEERMKLALKGVLVAPDFLFKIEHRSDKPGIYPIGQYEMASRLSYFLWSTMPDDELNTLAAQGRLQDSKVLTQQVERMLDDPRAHAFTETFIGQWLGTQDLGGRVVPLVNELNTFYTPQSAADLREEPVRIFERIVGENRSLLELISGNYTYLTGPLVKFYQLEKQFPDLQGNEPRLVEWPDNRRAGIMNLGSVMAMTSHYRQTSPVLRGAWILDTLLGTPVPPPPPNVPAIASVKCEADDCAVSGKTAVGMRQTVLAHRANPACAACHKLMDPMGFALENFDWTGRWRDKEFDGSAIDASGELPSGEKFNGPAELRAALLGRKDEFLRQVTGKVLGYGLGRSLQDGDSCTVQQLADRLQKDNYRSRTLIREVVLSVPFRNSQGGKVTIEVAPPPPPKVPKNFGKHS